MMKFYSVTDIKQHLNLILLDLSNGLSSIILKNNKPVATVIPYVENIEDIMESIAWGSNVALQKSILKAGKSKKGLSSAALRKKLGV